MVGGADGGVVGVGESVEAAGLGVNGERNINDHYRRHDRHQDPRTLTRYAKPGIEAVAAITAEFDRGRRHRQ